MERCCMRKLENFCRALKNLQEIRNYREPYDTVTLTGMVALYQICFEQAWKAAKEALEASGYGEGKTGSPKQILKTAYGAGMIQEEEIWLSALAARNNAANTYNEAIALELVRDTKERYLPMFERLREVLLREWV